MVISNSYWAGQMKKLTIHEIHKAEHVQDKDSEKVIMKPLERVTTTFGCTCIKLAYIKP